MKRKRQRKRKRKIPQQTIETGQPTKEMFEINIENRPVTLKTGRLSAASSHFDED